MAGGDREKALDAALANIEKQFGKGSVMRLGDETRAPLEVIPTGSISLDVVSKDFCVTTPLGVVSCTVRTSSSVARRSV